jgi:flagellar hook-basal body complex protein FliE
MESINEMPNFDRGTSGLPRGFIDDYNKIVKKLSKGKGFGTLSRSDKKKVWATLGKKYNESVNEAVEPQGNMAKIAKVVKDKQATKLSGVMIDMQSANLLMKLWDAVSDKDKEKMNKMNAKLLTSIIKKLWSRINLKLPI